MTYRSTRTRRTTRSSDGLLRLSAAAPVRRPDWLSRQVLLLNATYEPLTVLPARRAVVLMAAGKADGLSAEAASRADAVTVRSERLEFTVPPIVRLRTYVRVPYRSSVPMTRAALMHRDAYRCAYCGGKADTVDHVIPRSRGGAHGWHNCVACCAACNHRKADHLLTELGWQLERELVSPSGLYWRLLSSTDELHPSWRPYLGDAA